MGGVALSLKIAREVVEVCRSVGMIDPEAGFVDRKRTPIERLGIGGAALGLEVVRKVVEGDAGDRVPRPPGRFPDRQRGAPWLFAGAIVTASLRGVGHSDGVTIPRIFFTGPWAHVRREREGIDRRVEAGRALRMHIAPRPHRTQRDHSYYEHHHCARQTHRIPH